MPPKGDTGRMSLKEDLEYQQRILPRVSRTFALTIPQLPPRLRESAANAYLLCRLADTIEDDPGLSSETKSSFMSEFLAAVRGEVDQEDLARRLAAALSPQMTTAEHDLVAHTPAVLRVAATFPDNQRRAVIRCLSTMGTGMPEFQHHKTLDGLANLEELDRYCYFVAGVVGEMMTDLFCDHCEDLLAHRDEMMALAVCFGQGLQMTNILKDVWEDRQSDTCWLPRSVFREIDGGLAGAMRNGDSAAIATGIRELVAVAHAHLQSALKYTQLIPRRETGIRRFCLWAIGMAVLTLQKIHRNPGYANGQAVKISRGAVRATVVACNMALVSNRALDGLFALAARGLPLAHPDGLCPPAGARLASDRLV